MAQGWKIDEVAFFSGSLIFYLSAIDKTLKTSEDQPSIGIIICKNKNKIVAEYALQDIGKPIGISEYQLSRAFPEHLKSSLPSIEELEKELAGY